MSRCIRPRLWKAEPASRMYRCGQRQGVVQRTVMGGSGAYVLTFMMENALASAIARGVRIPSGPLGAPAKKSSRVSTSVSIETLMPCEAAAAAAAAPSGSYANAKYTRSPILVRRRTPLDSPPSSDTRAPGSKRPAITLADTNPITIGRSSPRALATNRSFDTTSHRGETSSGKKTLTTGLRGR